MVIQLVLFQIVTFTLIIVTLHLFFGTQLKIALRRLQTLHQESLEKEEVLNKEIERARLQAQSEIARSKEEARLIIEEAKKEAEKVARECGDRAQDEAKKIVAESMDQAKKREKEILAGVEQKAVGMAMEMIKYTFSSQDQRALHAQMIDELIEEFKKIDRQKFSIHAETVVVSTSIPLNEKEKKDLKAAIEAKLGNAVTLEEESDEMMIAGLVVRIGGLVVDGSLRNKFNRALRMMHAK